MALSTLICCKKTVRTRAELISYINDPANGLNKKIAINRIDAELMYKPAQLMLFARKDKNQTDKQLENRFKGKYYFVLSFSAGGKEILRQLSFAQYSEMVQVLSFRMRAYIDAVADGGHPIAPLDCLFQQTFGAARANQLVIVFEKNELEYSKLLQIRVKEFGLGTGDINFKFNTKDINDLSAIALIQ